MTSFVGSPHFTFRLERVRALRERAEDQAKEDYAASLAYRIEGAAMLRAAAEHRDQARSTMRSRVASPLLNTPNRYERSFYLSNRERESLGEGGPGE